MIRPLLRCARLANIATITLCLIAHVGERAGFAAEAAGNVGKGLAESAGLADVSCALEVHATPLLPTSCARARVPGVLPG